MSIVECEVWAGPTDTEGYGRIGKTKAHRVAWAAAHGPIPPGMCVCHRCDNRRCVRIDHLFLGTVGDNNRDRHQKGRSRGLFTAGENHPATRRRGERHWQAKLSDNDVRAIRERSDTGEPRTVLAAEYGVHSATISRIARGIWRQEVASHVQS